MPGYIPTQSTSGKLIWPNGFWKEEIPMVPKREVVGSGI